LPRMIAQAHYEGAPPLWHLMLRPLTLVTHRPEAMQVLTWLLAGGTMFIFLYWSPFNWIQKLLLAGNYFLLFEYGLVCRNYLPGVLLLVVACVLFSAGKARPWALAFALVGAAFASAHSLIVAVAIAVGYWVPRAVSGWRQGKVLIPVQDFLPLLTFVAGMMIAIASMFPRPDTFYGAAVGWIDEWHPELFARLACAFVYSHFLQPRPPGFFWIPAWNTPFQSFDPRLVLALSAALFLGSVLFLRRHIGAVLVYLVGTCGLALFLYCKYLGSTRHSGFFVLTFLFAYWIAKTAGATKGRGWTVGIGWAGEIVLTGMLGFQAVTGLWAVRVDYREPFSCGKTAAQYIVDHHLQNGFLAAYPDWTGSPLAGYLDRQIFYPQTRGFGSYTCWDTHRDEELTYDDLIQRMITEAKGADIVLSIEHLLPEAVMRRYGIRPLARFTGSLTSFEDYNLYSLPGTIPPKEITPPPDEPR
jgi:hypothetical protein